MLSKIMATIGISKSIPSQANVKELAQDYCRDRKRLAEIHGEQWSDAEDDAAYDAFVAAYNRAVRDS